MNKTNKKEIRKKMLAVRRSLEALYVREASHIICEKLKKCPLYKDAESICLYMPINNEVDVTELLETGKIYIPKIIDKSMDFYLYEGMDSIGLGAFGIPEPTGETKLAPNNKTLVVMPGVAFSRDGYRLGYGGGYYDTYLKKYPMCMKVAVCFKEQLVEELPVEEHDVKPDFIISNIDNCETRFLYNTL